MNLDKFRGVFPPVPTILDKAGRLDKIGMSQLIDKLINDGVNGFLFLGSGGEFCHMTRDERFQVAEFVVSYVNRRVPILLGISSSSTNQVVEYGRHADGLGVDAVLVLNPYYALLNDTYIYNHFKTVAESISTPVLIYNFPALTGQDIKVDVIKKLAEDCPNIIGIKDTVDNLSHVREIFNEVRPVRPDFVIFSGYDEYMMDTLVLGGNGGIPATANFAASITCGIYSAFVDQDYPKMFAMQKRLSRLSSVYGIETPFFGVVKEAICLTGLAISTEVLAPVLPLSEQKKEKLASLLKQSAVLANQKIGI